MKKLVLLVLLLCAVMIQGCDFGKKEPTQPTPPPKQEIKQQSFIVYRACADGREKLLPEKFTINDNGKPIAENALITLVSTKPQDSRMEDVFPIGTKVLGLRVDEQGTAYANFSKELTKKSQGSYGEMMLCYAIANTLTEFPEIKRVQILIEGKKVTTISGHMDVEEPLIRNKDFL